MARTPSVRSVAPDPARACVVVLEGDRPGRRICFEQELVLGRGVDAKLQVRGTNVSRLHAAVRHLGPDGWVLDDLGSTNGTFASGMRVERTPIRFGDRFRMGETLLLFTHHDRIQERLQQKQKLEVASRMSARLGHDLDAVLDLVTRSLDYLGDLPGDSTVDAPDVQACHSDIRSAVARARELTRRLASGSEQARREPLTSVCVATVVRSVATDLGRLLGDRITLRTHIEDEAMIFGHGAALETAIANLCFNAREALLVTGGRIELEVAMDVESAETDPRLGSPHVRVSVRDDGPGIDPAIRDRLFEPFFTTKGSRHNGLGLANVLATVSDHGGTIDVGRGERGTEIILRFPTAETGSRVFAGGRSIRARKSSWPLQILVADDDPTSRKSMGRVVEHLGHRATRAGDGEEVLRILRRDPRIQLVILDYEMPHVDGEGCFDAIRGEFPELRVAFASGSLTPERRDRLRALGAVAVFDKPFEVNALQALLDNTVEELRQMCSTHMLGMPPLDPV